MSPFQDLGQGDHTFASFERGRTSPRPALAPVIALAEMHAEAPVGGEPEYLRHLFLGFLGFLVLLSAGVGLIGFAQGYVLRGLRPKFIETRPNAPDEASSPSISVGRASASTETRPPLTAKKGVNPPSDVGAENRSSLRASDPLGTESGKKDSFGKGTSSN